MSTFVLETGRLPTPIQPIRSDWTALGRVTVPIARPRGATRDRLLGGAPRRYKTGLSDSRVSVLTAHVF